MNRNGSFSVLAAGIVALALMPAPAQADTVLAKINATWTGVYKGGKASGNVPTSTNPALPLNGTTTTGGGGLFSFTQGSTISGQSFDFLPIGASFVGFCIEFNEYIANNGSARSYNVVALNEAPDNAWGGIAATGMGVPKANLIATLLGSAFGYNGPPNPADYTADFLLTVQFAIWEIVHETLFDTNAANFALNVKAGNAYWSKENGSNLVSTIRDAAQALIVAAVNRIKNVNDGGDTPDEVGLLAIVGETSRHQDFVVWVDTPNQEVPLPAAAWLLLSGLAGLGVVSRRRKTQA
jgi:hypothetical protein